MDVLGSFLSQIWELFDCKMDVYGFVFSLRDVFMFSLVSSVVFGWLGRLFNE